VQQSRTDASKGKATGPFSDEESNNLANIIIDMRHVARYGSG
jgi:hypothetical protein